MADDRYDQLYQIRQQAAHQRYVQGLQNQAQANLHDYQQAIAENDMNAAAFAESEYRKNTRELAEMTGGQAAQQQQQQAPQQQQQQQFTEVERQRLREFPGIASDPKKSAEAIGIADALVAKHIHAAQARGEAPNPNFRNSPEYDSALRIGLGVTGPDGVSDGPEIRSTDAAIEATRGSQYCKDFARAQYDYLSNYRDELKKRGFYPMDPTA